MCALRWELLKYVFPHPAWLHIWLRIRAVFSNWRLTFLTMRPQPGAGAMVANLVPPGVITTGCFGAVGLGTMNITEPPGIWWPTRTTGGWHRTVGLSLGWDATSTPEFFTGEPGRIWNWTGIDKVSPPMDKPAAAAESGNMAASEPLRELKGPGAHEGAWFTFESFPAEPSTWALLGLTGLNWGNWVFMLVFSECHEHGWESDVCLITLVAWALGREMSFSWKWGAVWPGASVVAHKGSRFTGLCGGVIHCNDWWGEQRKGE